MNTNNHTAPDGVKIISLQAENFMGLKAFAVRLNPDGTNFIELAGPNMAGKTSAQAAIEATICGGRNLPENPLRNGEVSGFTECDLGNLVARREYRNDGSSRLVVTPKLGSKITGAQAVLDALWDGFTLDPMEFANLKPRERVDMILARYPLDVDLFALGNERKKLYERRTEENREIKRLEGQLASFDDLPASEPEATDITALQAQRRELEAQQERRRKIREELSETKVLHTAALETVTACQDRIADLEARLVKARAELATAETKAAQLADSIPELQEQFNQAPEPDFTEIDQMIAGASDVNILVRRWKERESVRQDLDDLREKVLTFESRIREIDHEKREACASAQFPVEGMTIDEDGVYLNGVPFDQCSTSEQIRMSTAIVMAGNPKLRVLFIRRGESLGKAAVQLICEIAQERGYDVWFERMLELEPDEEYQGVGVYIEDGRISQAHEAFAVA